MDKDNIITSHRFLIKDLYEYIEGLEKNVSLLQQVVKALRKSLSDNKIPLPDIVSTATSHMKKVNKIYLRK